MIILHKIQTDGMTRQLTVQSLQVQSQETLGLAFHIADGQLAGRETKHKAGECLENGDKE